MTRPALSIWLVIALASAVWADDAAVDNQWPPKPVGGLQSPVPAPPVRTAAASSIAASNFAASNFAAPAASPLGVPQPGAPAPADSSDLIEPVGAPDPASSDGSSTIVPGQPLPPFQLPDGHVIGRDGGVLTVYDGGAPLPNWSFSADAMFLQRTIGTDNRLGGVYSYNTHSFIEHLTSSDAGFNMEPGMRLQLTRRLSDQVSLEAVYFGLQSWSGGNTLQVDPFGSNTVGFSPYTQTDHMIGGFGTSIGYSDRSSLQNVEFNQTFKRLDFGNWRWGTLWGLRYLQFGDRLDINGLDNYYPAYENVNLNSTNNLLGLQIGALLAARLEPAAPAAQRQDSPDGQHHPLARIQSEFERLPHRLAARVLSLRRSAPPVAAWPESSTSRPSPPTT